MKLLILTNSSFVGDNNQLKGIAAEIEARAIPGIKVEYVEESTFDQTTLSGDEILFVSGEHGLAMATQIMESNPDIQVIWSGHQYFNALENFKRKLAIIALPETAVKNDQMTQLETIGSVILTSGVAHCVNETTIKKDCSNFKGALPSIGSFPTQIGIIIAGDAPGTDNKMKCFTKAGAEKQAKIIGNIIKTNGLDTDDTAIMLTNGPRTGKHNPSTGKPNDPDPHRSQQIDDSSLAFTETLKKELNKATVYFYDFQHGNDPSAYKPMMHQVACASSGWWFVPAESTSMVTEASFFLKNDSVSVVIYHPESENEAHLAHSANAFAQGLACEISDAGTVIKPTVKPSKREPAAITVANGFEQIFIASTAPKIASSRSTMYAMNSTTSCNEDSSPSTAKPVTP